MNDFSKPAKSDSVTNVTNHPQRRQSPLSQHRGLRELERWRDAADKNGIEVPYFKSSEGIASAQIRQDGRDLINFASYDYLGLATDPRVKAAAQTAIEEFGTTVSASRLVSGERAVHHELEKNLARCLGVPSALSFVSGHATNVSLIGYLFGPRDLVVHDWLAHNSILEGIRLSGAKRLPFVHQDLNQLDSLLAKHRHKHENVLIAVEGLYSMEGDLPDLPKLLEIRDRYEAVLMVDEAHSLGVLGQHGRGLAEHWGVDANTVDIWMGTLSKSLVSSGGYVAGDSSLIDNLKHWCPGFLYSVGLSPANAAAANAALDILKTEPVHARSLQTISRYFLKAAQVKGLNTATAMGYAIVPVIIGDELLAMKVANSLIANGINALPMIYPAVPKGQARIRFFLNARHTESMVDQAIETLIAVLDGHGLH